MAMAEIIPDVTGTPSPSGVIMAMEMAHTQGDIPTTSTRMSQTNTYHSPSTSADAGATNRAYNVLSGAFLAPAGAYPVMNYTGGGNNNNTSLFEQGDWAYLTCKLGVQPAAECTVPNVVGAPAGNDPLFFLAGTTDGTPAGTKVESSYFVPQGTKTETGPMQRARITCGSPITAARSATTPDHGLGQRHPTRRTGHPASTIGVFRAAVPFPPTADNVELLNGPTTVLYSRDRNQVGTVDQVPTLASTTRIVVAGVPGNASAGSNNATALSDDGRFLYNVGGVGYSDRLVGTAATRRSVPKDPETYTIGDAAVGARWPDAVLRQAW